MKLGRWVTKWERTTEVKVVAIVSIFDHCSFPEQRCNGCGYLLKDNLPCFMVGIESTSGGSGAMLCYSCGIEAEEEVAERNL